MVELGRNLPPASASLPLVLSNSSDVRILFSSNVITVAVSTFIPMRVQLP
jgi:hypothetical protein